MESALAVINATLLLIVIAEILAAVRYLARLILKGNRILVADIDLLNAGLTKLQTDVGTLKTKSDTAIAALATLASEIGPSPSLTAAITAVSELDTSVTGISDSISTAIAAIPASAPPEGATAT